MALRRAAQARVRETVKVELGVGREAETGWRPSRRLCLYAAPRRLGITVDPLLRTRARRQGSGTTAAPGCLTSALGGPYPDTKVAGISRIPLGGCRLVNHATGRSRLSLFAAVVSLRRAGRSKGRSSMGNRNFGWPLVAVALSALALSACSTTPNPQVGASAPPEPEIPARVRPTEIVGRWGYAAYHKPEDRTRTEANARGQCKQPYVIGQGANGGVMMYLADSSELQELRLKGSSTGKDYIGPAGRTPGVQDREIISFDGRVMILKYVDPEVDGRYGTGIFVRCAPRAAQASAPASR